MKKMFLFLLIFSSTSFAQVVSHCTENERIVFSCSTKSKKVISFCASSDNKYLQYRFGALDKIELVYPTNLIHPKGLIDADALTLPLNDDNETRNEEVNIGFNINSFRYNLSFYASKNIVNIAKKKDIRVNSTANLSVIKGDKQVTQLECVKNTISNVSKSILYDFEILE